MEAVLRPTFAELRDREGQPSGSSWGLWGTEDQIGALNRIGEQEVLAAARLVQRGVVFPLNWGLENPDPALLGRGPLEHHKRDDGFGMDDHFDKFFPHGSTHWDSLGHFSHPVHGYYGGRSAEQLKGAAAENSAAEWARRGVAGRFVLADVDLWRREAGRPIAHDTDEAIPIDEVATVLDQAGVRMSEGDILLVRMGWINWYERLDQAGRSSLLDEEGGFKAPGLAASEETLEWIWDSGAAAVATDVPAVEAFPFDPHGESLHANLLALLGINLGEMFALDGLAEDCAADGRYVGMLTSAPMNFTGATGSPANALALK